MSTETVETEQGGGLDSFAALFEASVQGGEFGKEGEIVKGIVVVVQRDNVIIDIGGKSEGMISLSEFHDAAGQVTVKAGDEIDVYIESRENDDGLVTLSKEKADKMKVWDEISGACERDELIEGTISQRVKGGLSVTIKGGVKAFLPGSQVDLRPIRNLDKLIGQTYQFKVIKFNKKRGNIVLSRRVLLEKERDEQKTKTLETLEEGKVVRGEGTRVFATVSHQHIYGLLFRVLWPLGAGRPFHANLLLHSQELFPRMLECRHAALVTTPVHLRRMAAADGLARVASVCRAVFSSGGRLEAETAAGVGKQLGEAPIEILGSTETGGVALRQRSRQGDLFTPLPGVRVEIEPPDAGLVVTSPFVSVGLATHTGERRFRMGDRAQLEAGGGFRLLGRSDRTVKIGEKRLSLPEMEKDLAQHPAVAEVALLVLLQASEQRVHAAVVLSEIGRASLVREGRRALGRALAGFLSARWDAVLLPRVWRTVDALPRNPQGKLPIASLAALFEPRDREAVLHQETRGEGWLERRLEVPRDLVYLDGHYDALPIVPAVAELRWVMEAAFDLLGSTPRVSDFEVLKFPEVLPPGQTFTLRVERWEPGGGFQFRLYEDKRVFASGRCRLAAASGEPL